MGRSSVFCQTSTKCPKCCTKSACGGQTEPVWGNLRSLGQKSRISGLSQPEMETHTRPEQSKQIFQGRKIQNGYPRNDHDFPANRAVGHIHRFQGHLLPHTNTKPIKEISEISCTGRNIPVQSTTIWLVHSSLGVHCSDQRVKLMALQKGIRIHQCLDDWLVLARSHQACL